MASLPSHYKPAPWWRSPRVAAVMAVALLHGALAVFFLSSQSGPTAPVPREVFYLFHPAVPRLPQRIEPTQAVLAPPKPLFRYAPSTAITLPRPVENALNHSLFDCAPDNLARLAPEQRKHCGALMAAIGFDVPFPGASRDAERWRDEISARGTPYAVPCTSIEKREVNPFTHETAAVVMADPLCALRNLSDGPDR